MANCCGCNKRVISNLIANAQGDDCNGICTDVCTTPQCGDPKYLTVLAPVIYDEIGINVCRSISIAETLAENPSAVYATAEVLSIELPTTGETVISQIPGRQNCYSITLSGLTVTFFVSLYDCCRRLLTNITVPTTYLPAATDPASDPETNPTAVTLEIFAPYGIVYADETATEPVLNVVAFRSTNSSLGQGLNLTALPKVLSLDTTAGTVTIGLTLIVNSIYFSQYQLPHMGKAAVSKGQLSTYGDSVCMDFVCGNLLDRNIKPLELCNTLDKKENCNMLSPDCDCPIDND